MNLLLKQSKIKVGIVDDHSLVRKGIVSLLNSTDNIRSIFDFDDGDQALNWLSTGSLPDIVILDVNMPKRSGYEIAQQISAKYPNIKIIALSMFVDQFSIIEMIKSGAVGYLTKISDPLILIEAINTVANGESYFPPIVSSHIVNSIHDKKTEYSYLFSTLTLKERTFLKLLCQELTYIEIGKRMFLSPRTIDDYRIRLCKKFNVKGKTGLVVFAIQFKEFL